MSQFKLLLEMDKMAASQPTGSKGPLRSLTDGIWNAGKSVLGGAWNTATAVPRTAWNFTNGMVGSAFRGAANSDGTLGGAVQGAFDSAWNHGGDSLKRLQYDAGTPFRTLDSIFNRPNAGPRYQAYGAQPTAQPAAGTQPWHPPMQTPTPGLNKAVPAVAQNSSISQIPGAYDPGKTVQASIKQAAPTNPIFRDTRPMHVQYPNVASHSTADRARVQKAMGFTQPSLRIPEPAPAPPPAPVAEPPAPETSGPTADHLAMFRRGTASAFDPNSKMDQWKMQQLISGNKQWASNPLYRASLGKQASVEAVMRDMPRDVYLGFLVEAFA